MNISKLVEIYKRSSHDAATIAEICDTIIDRSGGLLGEVRKAARKPLEKIESLELIVCDGHGYYWRMDSQVGVYMESLTYPTKKGAIWALYKGSIKWTTKQATAALTDEMVAG